MSMYCTRCGTEALPTTRMCPRCGNRTFRPQPPTTPAPPPVVRSPVPTPALAPAPAYCTRCGTEVLPAVRICPRCGNRTFGAQRPTTPAPPSVPPPIPAPAPAPAPGPAPGPGPAGPWGNRYVRAFVGGLVGLAVALSLSALLRPASAGGIPSLEYDGDAMRQEPLSVALLASQRFGSVVVPWPFAEVTLASTLDGMIAEPVVLLSDAEGRVSLDLMELCRSRGRVDCSATTIELDAHTIWDGKDVRPAQRFTVEGKELDARRRSHLASLRQSASEAASEGRWANAERFYQDLVVHDPEDIKGWLGAAEAAREAGHALNALLAFRQALVGDKASADPERDSRHRLIRETAVALAEQMGDRPGPTPDAAELLRLSFEEAANAEFQRAVYLAEAAEDAAPWWADAYEQAGAMRYRLWLENSEQPFDAWDLDRGTELGSAEAAEMRKEASAQQERIDDLARQFERLQQGMR